MDKVNFENEMNYIAIMTHVKSLLEQGIICEKEYAEIDTIMLNKYHPILGSL